MATRRIAFTVRGRVQGVAFRASCRRAARRLGVRGWVQNEADGSVSGEAEADAAVLREFCEWLGHGPALARVDHVDTAERDPTDGEAGFEIRR